MAKGKTKIKSKKSKNKKGNLEHRVEVLIETDEVIAEKQSA